MISLTRQIDPLRGTVRMVHARPFTDEHFLPAEGGEM
jgi:hypothetical protein